jgi:sterol 3beta-glucosyltransferase
MTGRSPEELSRLVLEAVALSGQRAILATGWGGIASASRSRDVMVIESAPHEWLFPRCSAVVHHGGAGTVATGLAAGRPTAVVAFVGDQPYWGHRVSTLGAGPPPILRRDLSAKRLADAIHGVASDESYRRSAERVGAALGAEDGVANAVDVIRAIVSPPH